MRICRSQFRRQFFDDVVAVMVKESGSHARLPIAAIDVRNGFERVSRYLNCKGPLVEPRVFSKLNSKSKRLSAILKSRLLK